MYEVKIKMNETQRKSLLQMSQTLIDNEEYKQALVILETLDCVMASWLKGIVSTL
jgi:hypothetical protein